MSGWLNVASRRNPVLLLLASSTGVAAQEGGPALGNGAHSLPSVRCVAEQTGGFHDYPGGAESYEPALFHPQSFALEENLVFMMNLAGAEGNADLYLTMTHTQSAEESAETQATIEEATELECRTVRGADGNSGYSCVNLPPSEMILINARTLRYTRTAVGGWTFAGASGELNGDSIFVEYGQCLTVQPAGSESLPTEPVTP